MSPQAARMILKKQIPFRTWIDTELHGGSKKAKKQELEKAKERAYVARLEELISLSDETLQWLLDNDWDPRSVRPS